VDWGSSYRIERMKRRIESSTLAKERIRKQD
jgi:hypothetical protein